jgi:hypothetical protein
VSKELNVRDIVDGSLRKAGHVCLEPNSLTFDLSMCNVAPRALRIEAMVLGVSSWNTNVFASHGLRCAWYELDLDPRASQSNCLMHILPRAYLTYLRLARRER